MARLKRKSKIVTYRLKNGRLKKNSEISPRKVIANINKSSSSTISSDHVSNPPPPSPIFNIEHDSTTHFIISGNIVKKKQKSYAEIKEKELQQWKVVTDEMVGDFYSKYNAIVNKTHCDICICEIKGELETIHCSDCGAYSKFCNKCFFKEHQNKPFHSPIKIHNESFKSFEIYFPKILDDPHTSVCPTSFTRVMAIVSEKGDLHHVSVNFCDCFSQFSTLLRLNLWPGTPQQPLSAISMELLHQFVSIQLEGKVSLLSFSDGLAWKNGSFNKELRDCLGKFFKTDSIDQFRIFRRKLKDFKDICPSYFGFSRCAACPQKNGSLYFCLDANFAMVNKTSASKSTKASTRSDLFLDDDTVEQFITTYGETAKDKDCHNFQAGTNLRSKSQSGKLRVTGVFGASCRHEFPFMFLNMKHGERLGYAVMILNHILSTLEKDNNLKVHIIYDIACVLKRHLEKKGLLDGFPFKFGIPIFHSYGHKGDCQVQNSIRRLEGFGLMDGELMERLWSYLRSFSKITKEMTLAHRVDMLSDALYHFGAIKMQNIGFSLVSLQKKAHDTIDTCNKELALLAKGLPTPLSDEILNSWKNEEDSTIHCSNKSIVKAGGWRELYFEKLDNFYKERSQALSSLNFVDKGKHTRTATKLDAELKKLEAKHEIERWSRDSDVFCEEKEKVIHTTISNAVNQLYGLATERSYLLGLKKRYADGSAIVTRLSKQINRACKSIKILVDVYNASGQSLGEHQDVNDRGAYDLNANIYKDIVGIKVKSTPGIPGSIKRASVQLFCRRSRAMEELEIVNSEMKNCLIYWSGEQKKINQSLESVDSSLRMLIYDKLSQVETHMDHLKKVFDTKEDLEENELFMAENLSSSSSEEDSEEDFDE